MKAETYRVIETDKKGKQKDKGWACDLVPKPLIVSRYFAKEQRVINALAFELEFVTGRLTELEEEHSGEDAPFSSFDKINKAAVSHGNLATACRDRCEFASLPRHDHPLQPRLRIPRLIPRRG